MLVQIAGCALQIETEQAALRQFLHSLFTGFELAGVTDGDEEKPLRLDLQRLAALPAPPPRPDFAEESAQVAVQLADGRFYLHFHVGGTAVVDLRENYARLKVLDAAPANGRLLDMLFTSLAPLLRRRGIYLVHAFAAAKNGRCLLLVGPSGSGKTTAGLALLKHGWRLLSNDVVAMRKRAEQAVAHTTPGPLAIRPSAPTPLPAPAQMIRAASDAFLPITDLLFPQITAPAPCRLVRRSRGVALATLMQESVDRWDMAALAGHLSLLQTVCAQAAVFTLYSGNDVAQWPQLLPASPI